MVCHRPRRVEHVVPGLGDAQRKVQIVGPQLAEHFVEPPELLEDVGSDDHRPAAGDALLRRIALPAVDLADAEGPRRAEDPVDVVAPTVVDPLAIVVEEELCLGLSHPLALAERLQELEDEVRLQLHVVVEKEHVRRREHLHGQLARSVAPRGDPQVFRVMMRVDRGKGGTHRLHCAVVRPVVPEQHVEARLLQAQQAAQALEGLLALIQRKHHDRDPKLAQLGLGHGHLLGSVAFVGRSSGRMRPGRRTPAHLRVGQDQSRREQRTPRGEQLAAAARVRDVTIALQRS